MGKFLERHKPPKLAQKKDHLNRHLTSEEISSAIIIIIIPNIIIIITMHEEKHRPRWLLG